MLWSCVEMKKLMSATRQSSVYKCQPSWALKGIIYYKYILHVTLYKYIYCLDYMYVHVFLTIVAISVP